MTIYGLVAPLRRVASAVKRRAAATARDYSMRAQGLSDVERYYEVAYRQQMRLLDARLRAGDASSKTTQDSKSIYEHYDDREQRDYESGSRECLFRGEITTVSYRQIKHRMIEYLDGELAPLIEAATRPIRVLEVGCGNCINLAVLREMHGDRIELTGIDISGRRLEVARGYFGPALDGIDLEEQSITERIDHWEDGHFDAVFSMHCLEQIAYLTAPALREMVRLSAGPVIMIEPVFELGNAAQRLYLLNSDHNRVLLKTVRELGYDVGRLERLDVQGNPLNQSSLLVIETS